MQLSKFTRDFLLLFFAPIVWALHFLFVYGFTGVACARQFDAEWFGIRAVAVVIIAASAGAIAFIAWIIFRIPKSIDPFLRWSAIALGMLAVVAVVWETLPVFIVPICN